MRHILCGGAEAALPAGKKRKRFPVSIPFRRHQKQDHNAAAGAAASKQSKSHGSGVQGVNHIGAPGQVEAPKPVKAPKRKSVQRGFRRQASPAVINEPRAAMAAPQVAAAAAAPVPYNDSPIVGRLHEEDAMTACVLALYTLFPNVCPDYLRETSESLNYDYESITSHILDNIDNGFMYPQRPMQKKRHGECDLIDRTSPKPVLLVSSDIDGGKQMDLHEKEDRALQLYGSDKRRREVKSFEYINLARTLCQQAYPFVPHKVIANHLLVHNNCLLPAILALDSHIAKDGPLGLSFTFKTTRTQADPAYTIVQLPTAIRNESSADKQKVLEEYSAALQILQHRRTQREVEQQRKVETETNFRRAQQNGTVKECECCFGDFAMNRMVHCDASLMHWFCRECAKRMAESQIGLSKYALECMSTDGCKAGFTHEQRSHFLDQKTTLALERIEQEHVLRVAGIESLETCPFCPFAAEYPPVEVNREFACQNPECEAISCRLCRKETHIPKTCAEAERANGTSVRLTIEEAMSAAMIRKCNKCGTPFIKELGCNKMSCSRAGCQNVQCYICHKSCDYSHFDDTNRGGKAGNCPLFESAEQRHNDEVQVAEELARRKLLLSNPSLNRDFLKIHLSDRVLEDDRRREAQEEQRVAAEWRR